MRFPLGWWECWTRTVVAAAPPWGCAESCGTVPVWWADRMVGELRLPRAVKGKKVPFSLPKLFSMTLHSPREYSSVNHWPVSRLQGFPFGYFLEMPGTASVRNTGCCCLTSSRETACQLHRSGNWREKRGSFPRPWALGGLRKGARKRGALLLRAQASVLCGATERR